MDINFTLIDELKKNVEVAESHINHLENMANSGSFSGGLDIPSVNELRYSLNHLLRYLTGEEESLHGAIKHTKRAIYDCYETEALYHFNLFSNFDSNNQDILMKDVFPNYFNWAIQFSELQEFIRETNKDSRDNYYAQLEAFLTKIRPFHLEIIAVQQEILKLRLEKERLNSEKKQALDLSEQNLLIARKTIRTRNIALIFTGLAAIIATIGFFTNVDKSSLNNSVNLQPAVSTLPSTAQQLKKH